MNKETIAVFPGSFNPFTVGHEAIVNTVLDTGLANKVIIVIGVNPYKDMDNLSDRLEMLNIMYEDNPKVEIAFTDKLIADFVKDKSANFIVKGLRNTEDYAYEKIQADVNLKLGIKTIFIPTDPSLNCL